MKPTKIKPKFQRSTEEQLHFFVDFCQQHPEMLAGRGDPQSPALHLRWRELADRLNGMKGPTRTPAKWKENLGVWKCKLRGRARQKRADYKMTDRGLCDKSQELKERALSTFGNAAAVNRLNGTVAMVGTLGIGKFDNGRLSSSPATDSLGPAACLDPASPPAVSFRPASPPAVSFRPPSPPVLRPTSCMTQAEAMDFVLRSIERRDKREEQQIQAQIATAAALQELSRGLLTLSKAMENLKRN